MSENRDIPFAGSAEELESILRDYVRTFGGLLHRPKRSPGHILSMGTALATNPNEIKWTARVVVDGETLRLAADVVTFPWSRRRAGRLLAARVEQFVDYLETRLRGGAVEKFSEPAAQRPFRPVGPGISGVCIAVASWAAQVSAAMTAVLLVSLLFGLIVVDGEVTRLDSRTAAIEESGGVPLPSRAELDSIGFAFRLGASALLVLPFVFFVGFAYGLTHVIGDVWARASRSSFWIFAFFFLLLFFSFWPTVSVVVALPFAILIPTAAHAGISLVWSFRRERRKEPVRLDPLQRSRRRVYGAAGVVGGAILLAAFVPLSGEWQREGLVSFRDRYLLAFGPGKSVAEFYYHHTRYVAEAIKPDFVDPTRKGKDRRPLDSGAVRIFLFWGADRSVAEKARSLDLIPDVVGSEGVTAKIAKRRHDFYLVDWDPKVVDALDAAGVRDRSLILLAPGEKAPEGFRAVGRDASVNELAAVLEGISDDVFAGAPLSQLSWLGWASVFFAGPVFLLLVAAGVLAVPVALLYRKAPAAWAHGVMAVVFLASMGGVVGVIGAHSGEIGKIGRIREVGAGETEKLVEPLSDGSAEVRFEAVFRAWQVLPNAPKREPLLFEALRKAMEDGDVRVRIWASGALGRFGDRQAVPVLLKGLKDPEMLVRYRAAEGLGLLKATEAERWLRKLMTNDEWYVGGYALAALRRIAPGRY